MIVEVLGWVAVADAIAAVLLAALVYALGRRSNGGVTIGTAVRLAIFLTVPAATLYVAARLISRLM